MIDPRVKQGLENMIAAFATTEQLDEAARLRERFEGLLAAGYSREDANAMMIEYIDRGSAVA